MRIRSDEYVRLKDCERMNVELEKEVKRLAELVSAEVEDCKIGPWCKDCKHCGYESSEIGNAFYEGVFIGYAARTGGRVQFCKKHLHELCPEFEQKG